MQSEMSVTEVVTLAAFVLRSTRRTKRITSEKRLETQIRMTLAAN